LNSSRLDRFRKAQDSVGSGFAAALAELQTTGKQSHWIWYVFPQLTGLGSSSAARMFAISGESEARDYLRDEVLRARLLMASEAVLDRLNDGLPLRRVMGSEIDVLKLVSSLTLFERVAEGFGASELECAKLRAVATEVLKHAEAQGYPRCAFTLAALR
jgi:uncharacterized protein (DUF1810 family)